MIEIVKTEIRRYVDMMDKTDIVFLKRILISIVEYIKERRGDEEQ